MPVVMKWNGTYSVGRARRNTIIATGLDAPEGAEELVIWLGYKTVAGAPAKPNDLHASKFGTPVARWGNGTVTTLSLDSTGSGRVVLTLTVGGGDLPDLVAGGYVWVGITATDDPTEDFLAVAGPKRAAP